MSGCVIPRDVAHVLGACCGRVLAASPSPRSRAPLRSGRAVTPATKRSPVASTGVCSGATRATVTPVGRLSPRSVAADKRRSHCPASPSSRAKPSATEWETVANTSAIRSAVTVCYDLAKPSFPSIMVNKTVVICLALWGSELYFWYVCSSVCLRYWHKLA